MITHYFKQIFNKNYSVELTVFRALDGCGWLHNKRLFDSKIEGRRQ